MTPHAVRGLLAGFGPGAQLRARVRGDRVQLVIIYNKGQSRAVAERAADNPKLITPEDFIQEQDNEG